MIKIINHPRYVNQNYKLSFHEFFKVSHEKLRFFYITKIARNFTAEHTPRKTEKSSYKSFYAHVHSSTPQKSQNIQTLQVTTDRWIHKQNMAQRCYRACTLKGEEFQHMLWHGSIRRIGSSHNRTNTVWVYAYEVYGVVKFTETESGTVVRG